MRLHRALARAGIASRRKAETLIAAGRVLVNGHLAKIGQTIDPASDTISVDGKHVSVAAPAYVWIILNKPAGIMTTRADPGRRPTVFDLVDDVPGLTYVGRLDKETEGVLLLTTDGEMAHRLTHPSSQVEREYVATVRGDAPLAAKKAAVGVMLHDGPVIPKRVRAKRSAGDRWEFEVVITEGRKREVRRLCRKLGLTVERLVRTRFGPVRLGALETGGWRMLTQTEMRALEREVSAA